MAKFRVLVASKDEAVGRALEVRLVNTGVHLVRALSGEAACGALAADDFDLCLADTQLEDPTPEMLARMLAFSAVSTPVVAVATGSSETPYRPRRHAQLKGILSLPMSDEALARHIPRGLLRTPERAGQGSQRTALHATALAGLNG